MITKISDSGFVKAKYGNAAFDVEVVDFHMTDLGFEIIYRQIFKESDGTPSTDLQPKLIADFVSKDKWGVNGKVYTDLLATIVQKATAKFT